MPAATGLQCRIAEGSARSRLQHRHRDCLQRALAVRGTGAAARRHHASRPQDDDPGAAQEVGRRGQQADPGELQESLRDFPNIDFIARTPLIPGINADEEHIRAVLAFIRPYKNVIDYELLPYHRFGLGKYQFLGWVYELDDYKSPSPELVAHLQAIIDEAFGRSGKTATT